MNFYRRLEVVYNLSQRWIKNNRDPRNIVHDLYEMTDHLVADDKLGRYKCPTSQHEKLLHDVTQFPFRPSDHSVGCV